MNRRKFGLSFMAFVLGAQVAPASASGIYVDLVRVNKGKRKLELLGQGRVLKTYDIRLGFMPEGHKRFQGDGKTPEGSYRIESRNPFSRFYRSLRIDYPNARDTAYARSQGRSPGGDIFIHGQVNGSKATQKGDWTRGCIALSDADMDELWKFIPVGCRIDIQA